MTQSFDSVDIHMTITLYHVLHVHVCQFQQLQLFVISLFYDMCSVVSVPGLAQLQLFGGFYTSP